MLFHFYELDKNAQEKAWLEHALYGGKTHRESCLYSEDGSLVATK